MRNARLRTLKWYETRFAPSLTEFGRYDGLFSALLVPSAELLASWHKLLPCLCSCAGAALQRFDLGGNGRMRDLPGSSNTLPNLAMGWTPDASPYICLCHRLAQSGHCLASALLPSADTLLIFTPFTRLYSANTARLGP